MPEQRGTGQIGRWMDFCEAAACRNAPGPRYYLGDWDEGTDCSEHIFQTRPDFILRARNTTSVITDTKWKRLGIDPFGSEERRCPGGYLPEDGLCSHLAMPSSHVALSRPAPPRPAGLSDGGCEMWIIAQIDISAQQQKAGSGWLSYLAPWESAMQFRSVVPLCRQVRQDGLSLIGAIDSMDLHLAFVRLTLPWYHACAKVEGRGVS